MCVGSRSDNVIMRFGIVIISDMFMRMCGVVWLSGFKMLWFMFVRVLVI